MNNFNFIDFICRKKERFYPNTVKFLLLTPANIFYKHPVSKNLKIDTEMKYSNEDFFIYIGTFFGRPVYTVNDACLYKLTRDEKDIKIICFDSIIGDINLDSTVECISKVSPHLITRDIYTMKYICSNRNYTYSIKLSL